MKLASLALQALTLDVPADRGITFDVDLLPGIGGWDSLQKLVADGYVAMISSPVDAPAAPLDLSTRELRFSKNPLVVEESARPGGAYAIVAGPSFIVTVAEYGAKVPGPTWVFPALVVGGVVGLIWLMRR
jgi:hypothetical protein